MDHRPVSDASSRSASYGLERAVALVALAAAATVPVIGLAGIRDAPIVIALSFVCVALLTVAVMVFVTTAGPLRWAALLLAVLAALLWVALLVDGRALLYVVGMIVAALVATTAAMWILRPRPYRPPARAVAPPRRAFLLMNPASGDGKVEQFGLVEKAQAAGAEVVLLEEGSDVVAMLEQAVRDGADLLGVAGGDGTQAAVAGVAAAHDLPMLCIPAGTRNHFATDLGLDRDDPSRAFSALGADGEEIDVDLGEVGGRPFVNNVSLGAYAEMVSRPDYREAKVQTALKVLPEVAHPDARSGLTIEAAGWTTIADPQVIHVANNPYARPQDPVPITCRPRLDTGLLGVQVLCYRTPKELAAVVAALGRGRPDRADGVVSWTGRSVTVTAADGVVEAGVDGEHMEFPSPLEISIHPGGLRVRVPRDRPGPKTRPAVDGRTVRRLWAIVLGR